MKSFFTSPCCRSLQFLGDLHDAAGAQALGAQLDEPLGILQGGDAAGRLDLDGGVAVGPQQRHIVKGSAPLGEASI